MSEHVPMAVEHGEHVEARSVYAPGMLGSDPHAPVARHETERLAHSLQVHSQRSRRVKRVYPLLLTVATVRRNLAAGAAAAPPPAAQRGPAAPRDHPHTTPPPPTQGAPPFFLLRGCPRRPRP